MSRVGVVGLGLIGGSFAKAYHAAGWEVLASNRTKAVLDFAILSGEVDGELTKENVGDCDLVLVTIYPEAAIQAIRDFAPYFGRKPLVMDCCGTKRVVCEAVFPIAEEYGFLFVGGHPMAGTQYSGYKYAKATMYHNAPLVIVPPKYDDIFLLDHVKESPSPRLKSTMKRLSLRPSVPLSYPMPMSRVPPHASITAFRQEATRT